MGSGNEQEYTVYKGRRKRTKRKIAPLVIDTPTCEDTSPVCNSNEDNTPKAISNIIRMRWHNDMITVHNKRIKMGFCPSGHYTNIQRSSSGPINHTDYNSPNGPPGLCAFSEPSSPIKFFENSTSARLFQIAQQHPPEYIPVPVMKPYMIPLYPDKEFYDGHGFIPSQFLVNPHN